MKPFNWIPASFHSFSIKTFGKHLRCYVLMWNEISTIFSLMCSGTHSAIICNSPINGMVCSFGRSFDFRLFLVINTMNSWCTKGQILLAAIYTTVDRNGQWINSKHWSGPVKRWISIDSIVDYDFFIDITLRFISNKLHIKYSIYIFMLCLPS